MKKIYITTILSIWMGLGVSAQDRTATEYTPKSPSQTFIGAILSAKSLNQKSHEFINVPLSKITISTNTLARSVEIEPSYENMISAVKDALAKHIVTDVPSFSYIVNRFDSYDELKNLFGQDMDLKSLLGTTQLQKTKKTLLYVDIKKINLTVDMDLIQNLCTEPKLLESYDSKDLIYVNSISFGRRAIIVVETNAGYDEVRLAIQKLLTNENPDAKSIALIANSTLRIIAQGLGDVGLSDENPLKNIITSISKKTTIDDYGAIIQFQAGYLTNGAMVANKY